MNDRQVVRVKAMARRGRPIKKRTVAVSPRISLFSPRGRPGRPDYVLLGVDHLEALRLADYLNKDQKTAAAAMKISQQTFSRILKKARQAVSDAIVNGKIIHIQEDPAIQEVEPKSKKEVAAVKNNLAQGSARPQIIRENPRQMDFWKETQSP